MAHPQPSPVVVITGASSGIGRATALRFAEGGARLVLAARREEVLAEVAEECRQKGTQAIAVPTDVRDEQAVVSLARRARAQYGSLDVWVNNAGVALFGRLEETPPSVYRQVIETNLHGCIHGARAAMRVFQAQGHGTLINVASLAARVPQPYTSAYSISKAGVEALGVSLREELALEGAHDIHVCTILPATVDTPLFQHAANYTGRQVQAMPPVYRAEEVADAIVACAATPKREVFVGKAARIAAATEKVAPHVAEHGMARMVERGQLGGEGTLPSTGNVLHPVPGGTSVSGGWRPRTDKERDRGTAVLPLAMVAAAMLAGAWAWRRHASRPPEARAAPRVMPGMWVRDQGPAAQVQGRVTAAAGEAP